MKPSTCIALSAAAAGLLNVAALHAQPAWPVKPVRIIVATSAGGPSDETARAIGPKLTEIWGQSVVIDNRPGAANIIAATVAAKSPPDGYTLLLANVTSQSINPSLRKDLPYDPQRDFTPVTLMVSSPFVLVVHPSIPVRSVKELVVLARAKPGRLNYASAGAGNLQHLSMELLQSIAHVRMNHIPYKGAAPAMVDLISAHVDLFFSNTVGAMPLIKAGRIRAIAISSARGSSLLPEVPAVAATYPGFDVTSWMGLVAPAGTPRQIVARASNDVIGVLRLPEMKERFASLGQEVIAGTPEQFADYVRRDTARYAAIIKEINLSAE